MNQFQSLQSGMGMLKDFYQNPGQGVRLSPLDAALKKKRDSLMITKLDPEFSQLRKNAIYRR